MRAPVYTRQFERDIKKARKRGKNLDKFKIIARALIEGKKLDPLHRDHQLIGDYAGRRECHIEAASGVGPRQVFDSMDQCLRKEAYFSLRMAIFG